MKTNYIIRLDDAAEYWSKENWERVEKILDSFDVKPLVGVIPKVEDEKIISLDYDCDFWKKVVEWEKKGWAIALHGFNHVYSSTDCGINPVHKKSEFAGKSYDEQKKKIIDGLEILQSHQVNPKVFFAPSHTFDENTIKVLIKETDIKIISDTIAFSPYKAYGITFVPQQFGKCKKMFFHGYFTFCLHPNTMEESDFVNLESFLKKHHNNFIQFPIKEVNRKKNVFDILFSKIYFLKRKLHKKKN